MVGGKCTLSWDMTARSLLSGSRPACGQEQAQHSAREPRGSGRWTHGAHAHTPGSLGSWQTAGLAFPVHLAPHSSSLGSCQATAHGFCSP